MSRKKSSPASNPKNYSVPAFCPNCGKAFNSGSYFCTGCGWKSDAWEKERAKIASTNSARIAIVVFLSLFSIPIIICILSLLLGGL